MAATVVVACSNSPSSVPVGTAPPVPSQAVSVDTTPPPKAASPSPSNVATPASPSPSIAATPAPIDTPEPEANVVVTQEVARFQQDYGTATLNYVVEVQNTGGAWANIHMFNQSYTVFSKAGDVLATGEFLYMFPAEIGPGEKGYFIESVNLPDGTKKDEIGKTEAQLSFEPSNGPASTFTFSNVKFKVSEFAATAIEVTGVVKNTSATEAPDATIGIVAFDANKKILGGFVDNDSKPIRANGSRGFR
ncbi:MAG: hypothetical protein H0T91_07770, partial [Propionibacteriaceae bacterium]|nr:hypothetical protein [Propionibacteriaceae bacterium]